MSLNLVCAHVNDHLKYVKDHLEYQEFIKLVMEEDW